MSIVYHNNYSTFFKLLQYISTIFGILPTKYLFNIKTPLAYYFTRGISHHSIKFTRGTSLFIILSLQSVVYFDFVTPSFVNCTNKFCSPYFLQNSCNNFCPFNCFCTQNYSIVFNYFSCKNALATHALFTALYGTPNSIFLHPPY